MMTFRVSVPLDERESKALCDLALQEKRLPRLQAAYIIRRELERLGLLPEQPQATQQEAQPCSHTPR